MQVRIISTRKSNLFVAGCDSHSSPWLCIDLKRILACRCLKIWLASKYDFTELLMWS